MKTIHRVSAVDVKGSGAETTRRQGTAPTPVLLAGFGLVASIGCRAIAQVPTEGLIGYWKGDHNALDSSPVGNHGSFGGSYVDGGPFGHAAFNLSNTQVRIPHNPAYAFQQSTGWTVGFWFNNNGMPDNAGTEVFLGQDNGSGYQPKWFIDYGYSVYHPTSSFLLHLNDFNQERIFLESNPVVPFPTGWNQLTVVVDNGTGVVSFYLNALPIGTAGLSNYVLRSQAQLVFGFAEGGLGYYGLLNNVTIYNRALSAQEVSKLVNPCFADFNEDGTIDFFDYDGFVQCFDGATCPPGANADFDGDGAVDFFDYDAFVVAFEGGC